MTKKTYETERCPLCSRDIRKGHWFRKHKEACEKKAALVVKGGAAGTVTAANGELTDSTKWTEPTYDGPGRPRTSPKVKALVVSNIRNNQIRAISNLLETLARCGFRIPGVPIEEGQTIRVEVPEWLTIL